MPTGPRPSPPTRCIKLVHHGSYSPAFWTNVLWLYATGSGEITHSDLLDLASSASSAFNDQLLGIMNDNVILESTQVVLYGPGDDVIDATVGDGGVGSTTGTALPANCACCLSWQIAPHYRGGHPRTYLCGFNVEDTSTTTSWSGSFITNAESAAQSYHEDLESIGPIGDGITTIEHGVVSFAAGGDWRDPPVFRRITGASVDSRIDTQRRRLGSDRS